MTRTHDILRRMPPIALSNLIFSAFLGVMGAQAAPTTRSGAITKFDGVDEIVEACTTATSFVNVPGMSRTFAQGGTASDEVVVTFEGSASLNGEDFDTGFVRLTIDGTVQTPGVIPLLGVGKRGTHGFNWQTRALSPGTHTARVQWRTDLGSSFCLDARSLLVLHR
jgi:hypothetical protein